jgi:lysophospholipase L1-like esterase
LLAGLFLAGAGIVFALVVFELGVRWMHVLPDRFWEADALLGARLIPNASGWWTQEEREFVVPVRINSHGRRDVERPFEKQAGTRRILVLGDSFVEALHVRLEDSFTRVLERSLAGAPTVRPTEIISAGVSGYGTAAEVLYFERDGRRYRPDVVLLAFYPGNDIKNNSPTLEDAFPPQYTADGTLERVTSSRPVAKPGGRLPQWQTYRYLRKTLLTGFPGLARQAAQLGLLDPQALRAAPERDGIPVDYGVYRRPPSSEWESAWQHTERLLERLRRSVEQANARLAIAILSTRYQVETETWRKVLSTYEAMQGKDWELDAPAGRVEAWCRRHDVPCVNMTGHFRKAAADSGELLHYPHDGHWTAAGHQLAARVLRTFLEEEELITMQKRGADNEDR